MHHDAVGGCFHKSIEVHTGGPWLEWLETSQVDDVKGFQQYNKQHHAAETLPVLRDVNGTRKLSSNKETSTATTSSVSTAAHLCANEVHHQRVVVPQ